MYILNKKKVQNISKYNLLLHILDYTYPSLVSIHGVNRNKSFAYD